MPATKTPAVAIVPRQWGNRAATAQEAEWDAAMEEVDALLPAKLWGRLVEAANGRAIGAYDFGVAWGIGQIPGVDTDAPSDVIFAALQAAMERLTALTAVLNERIR
jgi:hypothetical protein